MKDYFITYNGNQTIQITYIDAVHARETLKRTVTGITVINSTVVIPKNSKNNVRKTHPAPTNS